MVPRLIRAGHAVTVFELGGGSGMARDIGGVQVVPTHLDALGSDLMREHAERLKADAVVSLVDAWGMRPAVMEGLNWSPFVPVDHLPAPPAVVESLKASAAQFALSRFGEAQLKAAGFSPMYVPHAVDPDIWYPRDKGWARAQIGVAPDGFMAAFVGVNDSTPSRKGIPELLMAWSAFSQQHPGAGLYLHTTEQGNLPVNNLGGVRIDLLIKTLGIDAKTVKLPDQYRIKTGFPASELAMIVAAADVLILPTRGEGFGIPLIESQRLGTPVITTDFAAGAELCASGWLLESEPCWSWQSAFAAKPSVASIVERLEQAYSERRNPAYRNQAVEFARDYDVDLVAGKYLLPAVRTLGELLLDGTRIGVA